MNLGKGVLKKTHRTRIFNSKIQNTLIRKLRVFLAHLGIKYRNVLKLIKKLLGTKLKAF